jgi:5-methylcytosine-specific restriction endonuclease McrA
MVWEYYPVGGGELLTALAYADHAHDDGTSIRPSVAYIARKTRQSKRTVQRYLSNMKKSGWLQPVKHSNGGISRGGRGLVTEYRINPLWITNPDKLTPLSERMSHKAPKDDIQSKERMTSMSPQSSLNLIEPSQDKNNREITRQRMRDLRQKFWKSS